MSSPKLEDYTSGIQSDIGNVKSGGNFANAQSSAAKGGPGPSGSGFGSGGVTKGSEAAGLQSDIGNVSGKGRALPRPRATGPRGVNRQTLSPSCNIQYE
ncbi:hypothetical protein L202_07150 [Cryptococcus amylolentus CBS 6039]|uniref:Uncharacterized protein n=2 Tax=Cryptococcus amylolentus TaxID=104669 RepID=A0A1E3HFE4_9TREE|nr:hypothetical protein L202_07150 [Cryptococcus amylolentus CBS 6039]ODN74845.1 hypothetical protein L202_07150 [Cryptococcus amylolentus CBS 6039]ODO01744.1 hypothetical protein I350_06572 [Cryptococcus amylolentus CBS 6273]